ncbi:hypothetical protein SAMN05444371_2975 [Epilithonimonas mollis]|uniref:Uncharacterized protein n=1 Tax=Epilithonimonas mollis TaxID=216903 RepID=A0A1M6TW65_9FLAO|nr:hypothetical protein SAMN05444371_2975 [Epilithonimonas mollis]
MNRYQETIYKSVLIFSALINLFLIVLLFFVLRDSLSGIGYWFLILDSRRLWFFFGVVFAYSLANAVFIVRFLKLKSFQK